MNDKLKNQHSRRDFLQRSGAGAGLLGLSTLLADAGVPVQLAVVKGAFHGFDVVGARTQAVRRFTENQYASMRQMLNG